ncbi:MAG TPA: DUF1552 domain-containing protein, partial [Polyangiaceae bacterium]
GQDPVFSLFICAVGGVVPASFFPNPLGPLTVSGLAAAGKATSKLSAHAENLLFVEGINWPAQSRAEPHAESLCMALTAVPWVGSGHLAMGGGPSADWVIAEKTQAGKPPLTLYAGHPKSAYIGERLSFSSAGQVTSAVDNPYKLYQELVGIVSPDGTTTPEGEQAKQLLFESRKSIHDLVREELRGLMGDARMSSADKQRLQQHLDSVRDMETTIDGMGDDLVRRCSWEGVELTKIQALEMFKLDNNGMIEDVVRLHMSLVALAFACNYNRTATLQWGDGTDPTIYPVPSNEQLGWRFSFISHRAQSDGQVGNNPLAEQAHAEIDAVRMQTLAAGLEHFKARGLEDKSFVLWTNAMADGPGHGFRNLPHILWGDGGGYLKQGEFVDAGNVNNNRLLNTLISAAIQDTGQTMENFGEGTAGQLDAVLA